jgi:hypothetical protein
MAINAKLLAKAMIDAARTAAGSEWKEIRPIAEMQLRALSQAAADIEALLAAKSIDETRARALFTMHRVASRNLLQKTTGSRSSQVARVVTDVAVGVITGVLGNVLGAGAGARAIGNVTANFKAGKDL